MSSVDLAPPLGLPSELEHYFKMLPSDSKLQQKELRSRLVKKPADLLEVMHRGVVDENWGFERGNLLRRMFKDVNNLITAGKMDSTVAYTIRSIFARSVHIHRDIAIIHEFKSFEASRTILMGYFQHYQDFLKGGSLSNYKYSFFRSIPEISFDDLANEISFGAFERMYNFMEHRDFDYLAESDEKDLWDMVRFCDKFHSPDLKLDIEKALIQKYDQNNPAHVYRAFMSLHGCEIYELQKLKSHLTHLIEINPFKFHLKSDGSMTASIKSNFTRKDIELVTENSDDIGGLSLCDRDFNAKAVTGLIKKMPKVSHITLTISKGEISKPARKIIGSSIMIRSLKLNSSLNDSVDGTEADAQAVVQELRNIQQLDLRKMNDGYKRFALGLIKTLSPQLLDIRLQDLWVDDNFINAMSTTEASPLKLLDLGFCPKVTDEAAKLIAKKYRELVVLNIAHTGITNNGIVAILKYCKKIKDLNMSYCKVGGGSFVDGEMLKGLQKLDVSGTHLTRENFRAIVTYANELEELNVDRCPRFHLDHFKDRILIKLKVFTLNESVIVDEKSIEEILKVFPKIEKLYVLGNPKSDKREMLDRMESRMKLETILINDQQ